MNDKNMIILRKINVYIDEALMYTKGMDYAGFIDDTKTVNATAFVLGQIGELTKQISTDFQEENPNIHWRGIGGLRNRIVHDYENIDMTMLWDVIRDDLPALKLQIQKILL
ncbi:MAG: DUF86 domain-containing protein [Leptospirales bacterium]|nr:DUF86 domain-containing protein [Leptospirales bacterium]